MPEIPQKPPEKMQNNRQKRGFHQRWESETPHADEAIFERMDAISLVQKFQDLEHRNSHRQDALLDELCDRLIAANRAGEENVREMRRMSRTIEEQKDRIRELETRPMVNHVGAFYFNDGRQKE